MHSKEHLSIRSTRSACTSKLAERSSASDGYEAVPETAVAANTATVGADGVDSGGSDDELVE